MPHIIFVILIFLLGASVGSFLSVVTYRIENNKKGIILGKSYCPSCKKKLLARDMIPVISYLVLRGKCRHCHKKISPFYLFLEIVSGMTFVALYLYYPFLEFSGTQNPTFNPQTFLQFIFYTLYSSFFIGIFFYDLKTKKIPDLFLFPLIIATAIGSLVLGTPPFASIVFALMIAAVLFGGQIFISKGTWLGEGDLYLALALAIMFGWERFLVTIVVSYFLGALVSIGLLVSKKATKKTAIPFGPFLVLGALVTLFFGNDLIAWYITNFTI